ncbi:MAG: exopolyphosphatase, partial [Gammaproteobacteria bacterium]
MKNNSSETFAAVDLGSNSFHMIVAKYENERIQIIDRIKDMVRIASGLDEEQNLSEESMQRGLECLQRFGQRIREVPQSNIRVVGTNTLRQARNGNEFMQRAHAALGHNIDIVSGQEEARLVFLGVAHTFYNDTEQRLVIDIGGGSTELIIGTGFKTRVAESFHMGCVNISQRFFADGRITERRMRKAILFARIELESIETGYQRIGWDSVLG